MDRVIFVTGGTVGSGLAVAERFAKQGYGVVITSRCGERAESAAKYVGDKYGVRAYGYALDIRDEKKVEYIFEDMDKNNLFAEVLCLNSADMGYGSDPAKGMDLFECSIEEFQRVFETNLVWNFMIIRQAAIRMREHHKGAIVFISSNTAYHAIPNRVAYSTSKGGINAMSKALAVDLGRYGIRSNVVVSGTIKTERWVKMGDEKIVDGSFTPLGDISDFEDIANAVWYLGSDESKNVTGTEITVDGGMTCQLYPKILNDLKKECRYNAKENDTAVK